MSPERGWNVARASPLRKPGPPRLPKPVQLQAQHGIQTSGQLELSICLLKVNCLRTYEAWYSSWDPVDFLAVNECKILNYAQEKN
ncbi:hypothetical protein F2P81_001624 [Scophthalmus maximus]|uniref:Uncharacterized protein n=1 Tax=Scophthalmus maximus TaxID=52904 RepID=A0A6A4TIQ1_SCOMX|nr:hypothetical protein F2P81_001624 [Scophthalmus maximus]